MIAYGAYIIAILTALCLAIWFTRRTPWWVYALVLLAPLAVISGVCAISKAAQTRAHEFWGGVVLNAAYDEPWNEWVSQTCTRQNCTGSGKDQTCTSETYDCSYCNHHSASFDYNTTIGSGFSDGEEVWRSADALWQATQIVGKHESDCDGDPGGLKFRTSWAGDSARLLPYFKSKTYENRVQAAPTLFSFPDVEKTVTPVFDYPEDDGISNTAVMSDKAVPGQQQANDLLSWYNAKYGSPRQVHAYLLVVHNKVPEFGRLQEAYWKGGGKNELTTVVNLDAHGKVTWAYVFSWSPDKMQSVVIRDSLTRMAVFDPIAAVNLIGQEGVKKFVRKQFKDFSYIQIEPGTGAVVTSYILVLLLCVGAVVGVLKQDDINWFGRNKRSRNKRVRPAWERF